MMRPSWSGISGFICASGRGVSRRMDEITSVFVAPLNGRRPVAISYRRTPSEKISLR